MSKVTFLTVFFVFTSLIHAHEGDHHAKSSVQAPNGGIIQSLESVHLELLTKGDMLQVYIYNTDLTPADVSKYPVSAKVIFPKKKPQSIVLTPKINHWETTVNAKGSHRFTLEISIKQAGHQDKVKFTVEPKKK
jgi:hypothetical protein